MLRMKTVNFAATSLALVLLASQPVSAQVPDSVRAEVLQRKIISALEEGDLVDAKTIIAELRQLDTPVPTRVELTTAKIHASEQNYVESYSALERYFNEANSGDDGYDEAIDLFAIVEPLYETAKVEAEQQKAARQVAEKRAKLNNRWTLSAALFQKIAKNCAVYANGAMDWNSFSLSQIRQDSGIGYIDITEQKKGPYRADWGYQLSERYSYEVRLNDLEVASGSSLSCKPNRAGCISYNLQSNEFRPPGVNRATNSISLQGCSDYAAASRDVLELTSLWNLE